MSKKYDTIIVGGGLAGLSSAAYLCKYGYRTLVCEKSKKTGGLVNTFWYQGYAFDAGIRAFENSGILFPMLKNLGLEMEFTKNSVSIGIENRWTKLSSKDSLNDYAKMLSEIFPKNTSDINKIAEEIEKVMAYMDVLYGIDNPLFIDNIKDPEYLTKTLLPWFFKYQINIRKANRLSEPVDEYLKRFTDNEALIDMIVQHFFKSTPTFFALSYFGLYLDYCYPKGGTGTLAKLMTDYIIRSGGEILTETEVKVLDADKKVLYTQNNSSFEYEKLVWAANQKTLYKSLIKKSTPPIETHSRLVEKGRGGDSVLSLFMGIDLDRSYFEKRCGAHAFYTPVLTGLSSMIDWKDAAETTEGVYKWLGQYLERTTYEISCPVLRDETLAPDGKTGVIVSTLMDYQLVKHLSDNDSYEKLKDYCKTKIIEVLEASVFPGITKKIEFAMCSTPLTIEKETSNAHGAITGWAFTEVRLPAEKRFKKILNSIKTPIDDVYQCGQWSFSPSGLPVSILTGKLSADTIHKTLKGTTYGGNSR